MDEYVCECRVKCLVSVEAESRDDAVAEAEEAALLGCDEIEGVEECVCSPVEEE